MGKKKSFMREQLKKRKKVVDKNRETKPNYFDIRNYFDLKLYSTYIFIKPRSIGATYSAMMTIREVYEENGEYTVWMRTSDTETKEIIQDYKSNRPPAWKEEWKIKGSTLIDESNGRVIIKFVSLSTVHNLASITGDGCFGLVYDEFLPRTTRRLPKAFHKITDFLKTIERKDLLTVILMANATTLNSDILHKWDLWNDINEKDDKEKRLRYRYFTEWSNPPKVHKVSTASMWAKRTDDLNDFFDKAKFADGDNGLVLPYSRLGSLRHYYQYMLDGSFFTMSLTDDDMWIISEGLRMGEEHTVWVLTTVDGFENGNFIRPFNLKQEMDTIRYALENDNLKFTSYEIKDKLYKFLQTLYGRVQKG